MIGNDHFWHFAEVEDPMAENNEVWEEIQAVENVNFNEDFMIKAIYFVIQWKLYHLFWNSNVAN